MSEQEKKMNNPEESEVPEEADLVSLVDDEGNEYEFQVLDEMDYEEGHYYALLPLFDLPEQDIEQGETYMIFEAVEDEDGNPQLAEIEDEDLLDEIAEVFESRFAEMDEEEDEDPSEEEE